MQRAHRAHVIRDRMEEIERAAQWACDPVHGREDPETYWATAEEAHEYRALMCEWWRLPASGTTAALQSRLRPGSGSGTGWATRGRNRLLAKARATGQTTITEGGCTYRLFPEALERTA